MIATEQNPPDALPLPLPLAVAAARLGIRPDALRMRINRGKIKGFKRGGRLFAVLEAMLAEDRISVLSEGRIVVLATAPACAA